MLGFVPPAVERVLDVGCNVGSFGHALKAVRSVEVWGIEPSAPAAASAALVLDRVLCTMFAEQAELPDAYFDAIVFNDVLEHMAEPWDALRLAATKLRMGGCVASIPNLRQIDNLIHILMDRDFRYERLGIRDHTHLRFFTRISATRMFVESGYEILHVQGINEDWWTPSLLRRLAFRALERWLEDTKYTQFAIVARPIC